MFGYCAPGSNDQRYFSDLALFVCLCVYSSVCLSSNFDHAYNFESVQGTVLCLYLVCIFLTIIEQAFSDANNV